VGCCRESKIPIREVVVDVGVVSPVEEIEDLKPELKINSLRKVRVFVEVDVSLVEVWPVEAIGLLVSVSGAERGYGEIGLRNSSAGYPRAVRAWLTVATVSQARTALG